MSPKIFLVWLFISFLLVESVQPNEIQNNVQIKQIFLIKKFEKIGAIPSQSNVKLEVSKNFCF